MSPFNHLNDFVFEAWHLLWVLDSLDHITKFTVITIKTIILLLPNDYVSLFEKVIILKLIYFVAYFLRQIFLIFVKGLLYSLMETSSLIYRIVVSIYPWMFYLTSDRSYYSNSSYLIQWSPFLICILYIIFKILSLLPTFSEFKYSIKSLLVLKNVIIISF
jgi:hypothetical protein